MAKIRYSGQALANLEQISDFLSNSDPGSPADALDLIDEAINILTRHPLIGRPVESGLRELVISEGRTGYIALYSYAASDDAVLVLAIRHQREAGYHR